jgi:hypothetical protein
MHTGSTRNVRTRPAQTLKARVLGALGRMRGPLEKSFTLGSFSKNFENVSKSVVETSICEYWYVCTTNGDVPKENSTQ